MGTFLQSFLLLIIIYCRDTDSIFILFPNWIETIEDAFKWLKQICDAVTTHFAPSPIMLQAEKVMRRVILINKKRYISAKYESVNDKGKVLAKGVEIARRDNCGMVVKCMTGVVDAFLIEGDEKKGLEIIENTLRGLLGAETDLGDLVVSKAITKETYATKSLPAHLAVAQRMQKRDPSYEAAPAERIPFVIVCNGGKSVAERAEDPLWAINHQMPIDVSYYIEKQLAGPVARILMWKYGSAQDKHCIEKAEAYLRELQEKKDHAFGDDARLKKAHDTLVKAIKMMQEHVVQRFFGPAALGKYPRRVQSTAGKKGSIDSFFKRDSVPSATASADVEDFQLQAAAAKAKCDKCRGYSDEVEIKCCQRDCLNLYKRASIAIKLKQLC